MAASDEIAELVTLVDRLEALLLGSGLAELEVEVGETTLTLRSPTAAPAPAAQPRHPAEDGMPPTPEPSPVEPEHPGGRHEVLAPLTGVFYGSPSPDAEPYVREGKPVSSGQVIGLIEAMKLFNEIKSDVSGTVRRIAVGDGDLVKAKQTLIEVDPA